jgi:predicted lactoylglutathione lyase
MRRQIFVNLPVKDLGKSVEFFTKLGFRFDEQFTDKNAASMIIGEDSFVMLLTEPFFQKFTKKAIAHTDKSTEAIIALSAETRADVDELLKKALAAGGREERAAQDHGWMYGRSFEDLDGHLWEMVYMDVSQLESAEGGDDKAE